MLRKSIMTMLVAAFTVAAADAGGTKLFPDSQLVVESRFSDEIVGRGADLVFIPGLGSSRQTWTATAERLRQHYRLHLIQVAGFAGEEARANGSGPVLAPTAEAIDAYLVAHQLAPATLVGHSLGGTMVLYLAQHHPDHLKKVMLVDALPFFSVLLAGPQATAAGMAPMADRTRQMTSQMPMSDQEAAAMATAAQDRAMIGAWAAASDTSAMNNALADDMTLDLRPGLAAIALPITLVYPDYTPLGQPAGVSAVMYRAQYADLKGLRLVEIKNSVHFVMLDQPAQFATALDDFLKE